MSAAEKGWALDARIAATSLEVCDLPLCHVRLQDDARWPWLVLIPRRPALVEIEDLAPGDRARLVEESVRAGDAVRAAGAAAGLPVDKLNVGALGNVVAQLHVHVVGRRRDGDPAGAGPVWGYGAATPWPAAERASLIAAVRDRLR
jgi:diadenosine tetraphosphate (Ap4A) HIT family hydrolase